MVKIRLRRMGSRNHPFYRVVVSDSRKTPTGSALEEVGYYDPRREPIELKLDRERIDHWVSKGAQLSATVKKLVATEA
jgi:small subunit ribosomal protein S16